MDSHYRCDSCEEPYPVEELTPIRAVGKTWFRCKDCIEDYREGEKLGTKPRSSGYYAGLRFKHIHGWEDPDKVIRFYL